MFGDHDCQGRDVEHLPANYRRFGGTGRAIAAPAAGIRQVPDDHVRVGGLLQGGPGA